MWEQDIRLRAKGKTARGQKKASLPGGKASGPKSWYRLLCRKDKAGENDLFGLRMAGRTGTAGKGLLLFRTGLDDISMATEAGVRHMAATEDLAVVNDLEVGVLDKHIFRIMAASGTALELGSSAGDLMMAHGALLVVVHGQRGEVGRHLGVASRTVRSGVDVMVEVNGLLRAVHLDGAGGDMCKLRGGCRQSQSGDKKSGGADRQQLFHRGDLLLVDTLNQNSSC